MINKISSLLQYLKKFPPSIRAILLFLCACLLFFLSSCGTTRAVVRNGTQSAVTTISITTNNPIDVNTSPDVITSINPRKNEN